jgi:hypothetical protein
LLPSAGCWAPWPAVPAAPTSSCPCSRTQPAKSIQRRQRLFLNDSSNTPCQDRLALNHTFLLDASSSRTAARLRVLPGTSAGLNCPTNALKRLTKQAQPQVTLGKAPRPRPGPRLRPMTRAFRQKPEPFFSIPRPPAGCCSPLPALMPPRCSMLLKSAGVPAVEIGEVLPPGKPLIGII